MNKMMVILVGIIVIIAGIGIYLYMDDGNGGFDPTPDDPNDYVMKVEGRIRATPQLLAETDFDILIDGVYFQVTQSFIDKFNDWYNTLGLWTEDLKLVMSATVEDVNGTYVGVQTQIEFIDPISTPTTVGYGDFSIIFDGVTGALIHEGDTITLDIILYEKSGSDWKSVVDGSTVIEAIVDD